MLFIVIVGALVVVAAMLGLSICRVAALSDCNSAVTPGEWIAASHAADRRLAPTDRAGEQLPLVPPGEAFREAG
jgi:hypothetical protein